MQKHITSYLIVLIIILILAASTFFTIQRYNLAQENNKASLSSAKPLAVDAYKFLDNNNGDGTCWRATFLDDGTPVALFAGIWTLETNECRFAANAPVRNLSNLLIGVDGNVTARAGEEYFRNETTLALLQIKLNRAGVLTTNKITGTYTPETFLAIKAFQTKNKLPVTGYPNAATIKALNSISLATTSASTPATR